MLNEPLAVFLLCLVIGVIVVALQKKKEDKPSQPQPAPLITRGDKVEVGYFGQFDNQNQETADHVTYAMPMDWGDWDTAQVDIQQRIIRQLQDAKAKGITKAIVAVGFLTWTKNYQLKGTKYLQVFRTQLETLGLLDMVEAFYPIDEPDVYIKEQGLTEDNLEKGLLNVHTVFPEKHLMVIYGDNGTPAQAYYDIVGKDKYGKGLITIPLLPNQRLALVRGGSDPWKEDPTPAVDYALSHPEVQLIVWFIYGDYAGGKGIRNNGMLPKYKEQSLRLKG